MRRKIPIRIFLSVWVLLFSVSCVKISANRIALSAIPLSLTTQEGSPVDSTVSFSDGIGRKTFTILTGPSNGTVTIDPATGAFHYIPNDKFFGIDSFQYVVVDDLTRSVSTVEILVAPDKPVSNDLTLSVSENASISSRVSANDADNSPLTFSVVTSPTNGQIQNFDPVSGNFIYVPNPNYVGLDTFTFKANDGTYDSQPGKVSICVYSISANPAEISTSGLPSIPNSYVPNPTLSASESACSGHTPNYIFSIVSTASKGVVTITNVATGAFTYTANVGAKGKDTFTFQVSDGGPNSAPATITIDLPQPVVAGSMGEESGCALLADSNLKCWGLNDLGQLGLGDFINRGTLPGQMGDRLPSSLQGVSSIAAGSKHFCALLSDGSVKCWGNNSNGQLGIGNTTKQSTPMSVTGLGPNSAKAIAAGGNHSCALLVNNTVSCWGENSDGQLGLGDTNDRSTPAGPVKLGTGLTATQLVLGDKHSCAILNNSSLKCWGYNLFGQLGQGNITDAGTIPNSMGDGLLPISLGTDSSNNNLTAKAVGAGVYHTCAILSDNSLKCWGRGRFGELGLGTTFPDNTTIGTGPNQMGNFLAPVNLGGLTATSVGIGNENTCALLSDNSVKCWGYNPFGQLGLENSPTELDSPGASINFGTGLTVNTLMVGWEHSCAILNNNLLKCWGQNGPVAGPFSGDLGLGDTMNRGDVPGTMGDNLNFTNLGSQ